MKNQELDLRARIEDLKTAGGIEESIREKFQVVKEKEGMIVILSEDNEDEKNVGPESKGIFQFLKNLFK